MAFNPISCGVEIGKVGMRISGFDPRTVIKSCMWSTLSKGKGAKAFKKCVSKKIAQNVQDITNPDEFAQEIWDDLKKKCS